MGISSMMYMLAETNNFMVSTIPVYALIAIIKFVIIIINRSCNK